jgi:DNA-binding MarR family transcriptional regulator
MQSDLSDFLPYLLNQAAEMVSLEFQPRYKERYNMLRTEWRVLFHLGRHGEMTAKQICDQAVMHKTKVSRAVRALEAKRYLSRKTLEEDRRSEILLLTKSGRAVFDDLASAARDYDSSLEAALGAKDMARLKAMLNTLIQERTDHLNKGR